MTTRTKVYGFILGAVLLLAVLGVLKSRSGGGGTPTISADEPVEAARRAANSTPDDPSKRCSMCRRQNQSPHWYFSDNYLDAKCVLPVVHATFEACVPISLPSTIETTTSTYPLGKHKPHDPIAFKVLRQLSSTEIESMHSKREGKCVESKQSFKRAPLGCQGKMVCRGDDGALRCDNCRRLGDGCPDFEGSAVYLAVTE